MNGTNMTFDLARRREGYLLGEGPEGARGQFGLRRKPGICINVIFKVAA
jgi:hypothetical protein